MLSNNVAYTVFTPTAAPTILRLSPFAGLVEQTLHATRVPRDEECAVLAPTYIMQLTGFFHIPARHFRVGLFPRPFLAGPEGSRLSLPLRPYCDA